MRNSLPPLWYPSKKIKARRKPFSEFCMHPCAKIVEIQAKVLKLWRAIFHAFFAQRFEQGHITCYWRLVDHFPLHREHLFLHLWSLYSYTFALQCFTANFTASRITNCRTRHTSLYRQEQTLGDQMCDGSQGSESCDATSYVWAPPCSYISCLK
jgi:hypothetical protein